VARTIDQWIDQLAKSLKQIPEDQRRAKAEELVRGVRIFQANAPRSGKRLRSGAARGYPALVRSIKTDSPEGALYTEHPGADIQDKGGVVRPLRGRFLVIPVARGWFSRAGKDTVTLPISGGRRVVLSEGKARRLLAILVPFVTIKATQWATKSAAETARGSEDRIADHVLRDEVRGG
jgi:hypothetical protein